MSRTLSTLRSLRRQLPLPVRMGYGWLRRKFVPHPTWDHEYFRSRHQWLQESQWWSRDQLEEYQLDQLQALVQHAYENVPYYRRVFDERRLKPEDVRTLEDLRKIPLLTKEDVRRNSEDLIARNVDRERLRRYTTGGSTGAPLGIYHDKYTTDLRESAFVLRQWGWAGYRFGDRFVTLRDPLIGFRRSARGFRWDYNSASNELVLSSMDMSEDNMYEYVALMRRFEPGFIYAFPSCLDMFARFMRRNGISDIKVDAIFCSSETLYPQQRKLAESQFGCKIFDYYGLTEFVVGLAECEQHEGYHANMEYGILELIDRDGEPIAEPGTLGRVVGSGFGSYCMPLLRYATNDLAAYASGQCRCGRESTLIGEIRGRLQESVVSKTGRLVPFLTVYDSQAPVWAKFRELKVVQEKEGELVVEIARVPSFSESEIERELLQQLYERLGEQEFSIEIAFVDHVRRTQRGKLLCLEQSLPIKFEDLEQG
jgi:phenylacetate-CoA ligase